MAPRSKVEKEFIALNAEYDDTVESYAMLQAQHPKIVSTIEAIIERKAELKEAISAAGKALFLEKPDAEWLKKFDGRAHHIDFSTRKSFNVKKFIAAGGNPEDHPGVFKKKYTATIAAAETAVAEGVFNGKMADAVLDCIETTGASCTFRDGVREE